MMSFAHGFRVLVLAFAFLVPSVAFAAYDDIWATWMPAAASPVKHRIHEFHNILLVIIIAISVFVTALLLYTVFRFARAKNPTPSKTTHNVTIEIIWTAIPCLILAVIMWYSFPLMYYMDKTAKPDLTLKVTGYQWYWGYAYPDQGIEEFALHMVPDAGKRDPKNEAADLRAQSTYQRLLSTYDQVSGKPGFVVLPVNKDVRVLVTGGDVLHAFAMPAFGVKKDAVPGRLNETWMRIEKPGIYYGQCSELCGTDHGFMPIEIRAVDDAIFATWAEKMKTDVPAAMAYVQNLTIQYARPQITAPRLTLGDLWDEAKKRLQ
jgi:cytochrome c oxidase subunit 2